MKLQSTHMLLALTVVLSASYSLAESDHFEGMTYQEGFTEGMSFAIAAMAYKANGMKETPYPVEMPTTLGWEKTQNVKVAAHSCVRDHVTRDLEKRGGGTNVLYKDLIEIARRVYAYCGVGAVQLP